MQHGVRVAGVCVCMVCALPMPALHAAAPPEGPQAPRRAPPPRLDPGLSLQRGGESSADVGPKLEPIGGGRLRHSDPRFTAIVEPDGSVKFKDARGKPALQAAGFDPLQRRFTPPKPAARDDVEERALYPEGPPTAANMIGVGANFGGLSDWLIGTRHAGAKARFLRETEGLRLRMAHAWLKERLKQQLDGLVDQLLAIWRDTSLPLVERRRRIFVAWDDCDEAAPGQITAVDEIRGAAGAQARAKIVRLIGVIAPRGSPQQYSPEELRRLNAGRRSRARFEPYAGP